MSPSYNHAYLQLRLGGLLLAYKHYTPFSELSIEINEIEYKPDISLYTKRGLSLPLDIVRMKELPLLIIEILSPSQSIQESLEKFKIYFEAGVKSCWLVISIPQTIMVFSDFTHYLSYNSGEVADKILNINLPFADIFDG